ncbi:MAG: undecaprenyl-diphosphatase UppP [Desulforhopalus sp.]|nr:undecaprenyl-diphosphatase UppP [Desulforhopalus sp.]
MELLKAIVLGIVQGLTEFLPVSSSGHLVIGSELLNFHEQGVVFDVCLHLGTLVSVVIVFREELLAMVKAPFALLLGSRDATDRHYFRWDMYVVLATLPAVFVGLFFKDAIQQLFSSLLVAYCMLVITGLLMIMAQYLPERDETINWSRSLLVGCAQACAILPGLSRSGSTIFAGMFLGIAREKVARFSFIMSIPAIIGAAVLQFGELFRNPPTNDVLLNLVAGTVMAAVAGYFAIKLLLDVIRRNRLQWFGYYCLFLATIGLTYHFLSAA